VLFEPPAFVGLIGSFDHNIPNHNTNFIPNHHEYQRVARHAQRREPEQAPQEGKHFSFSGISDRSCLAPAPTNFAFLVPSGLCRRAGSQVGCRDRPRWYRVIPIIHSFLALVWITDYGIMKNLKLKT